MKLIFKPIKPMFVNQKFGANLMCRPVDGSNVVMGCDGNNPPTGWKSLYGPEGHKGVDLRSSHGQPVYAAQDGVVYKIDTSLKSGLDVRIEHEVNGVKFRTIYEHLKSYDVEVGQKVRVGQIIGRADNTGYSSGDHLHFEMLMFQNGKWVHVDPLIHMEEMYATDALKMEDSLLYLRQVVAKLLEAWASSLKK